MMQRYGSGEIPHARIKDRFQGHEQQVQTDGEGYFHLTFENVDTPAFDEIWHPVELELLDTIHEKQGEVKTSGRVVIPQHSEFRVISDVDDNILLSHSADFVKKIQLTFLHNAKTRVPFEGVAAFYQALQRGSDGQRHNPVFYVSSSPWNMYDMLEDFFRINELPKGPILLRDIGLTANRFIKEKHARHKLEKIRRIMAYNPELPFVLIGDSGQHDPEIYQQVTEEFPGRVRAIYIRDVTPPRRKAEVEEVARKVAKQGIDFVIKSHTAEAVTHAEEAGLIVAGSREQIQKLRAQQA